jgi:hypothetical protein
MFAPWLRDAQAPKHAAYVVERVDLIRAIPVVSVVSWFARPTHAR